MVEITLRYLRVIRIDLCSIFLQGLLINNLNSKLNKTVLLLSILMNSHEHTCNKNPCIKINSHTLVKYLNDFGFVYQSSLYELDVL